MTCCAEDAVQEKLAQTTLYRKTTVRENAVRGNVQGNGVQKILYRSMLCMTCCTGNIAQEMLYRK